MTEFKGAFFGRANDGSVRIIRLRSVPLDPPKVDAQLHSSEALLDLSIPAETWASLVSGVSLIGETPKRHYEALAFHSNTQPV